MTAQLTLPDTDTITLDAETAGLLLEVLTVSAGNVRRLADRDPYAFSLWREALERMVESVRGAGVEMPARSNPLKERLKALPMYGYLHRIPPRITVSSAQARYDELLASIRDRSQTIYQDALTLHPAAWEVALSHYQRDLQELRELGAWLREVESQLTRNVAA